MRLRWSLLGWVAGPVVAAVLGGTAQRASAAGARSLRVQHGVLTVDGLTAKTGVELKIARLHYLYIALPGSGTAIIAERAFPGAQEQKAAFQGSTLTVTVSGHRVQLTAANRMRGLRSAYVRFQGGASGSVRAPAVSYGEFALAPAIWPEEAGDRQTGRKVVRITGRRAPRTAKLCRPSMHGPELCATVREVIYKP